MISDGARVQLYVCPVARVPPDHRIQHHYLGLLSAAEKRRYDQYRPEVAYVFLVARVLLRSILATRLGIAPHAVNIQLHPDGKPFVQASPPLYFNLAHADDVIILAVTEAGEVGVDVERANPAFDWMRVASVLSPHEMEWIRACEGGDSASVNRRFFQIWTLKEAYVKCTGEGIQRDLHTRSLHVTSDQQWTLHRGEADREVAGYRFKTGVYARDFIYAVCLAQGAAQSAFALEVYQTIPCISTHLMSVPA